MTKLEEKEVLQRLEKIRINSSYYTPTNGIKFFEAKDKDVNAFCFNIKKQKILALQKRQWQRRHEQIMLKRLTGTHS